MDSTFGGVTGPWANTIPPSLLRKKQQGFINNKIPRYYPFLLCLALGLTQPYRIITGFFTDLGLIRTFFRPKHSTNEMRVQVNMLLMQQNSGKLVKVR